MIAEIVTTGTELLLGEITNENSRWLAEFLNQNGYTVAFMSTVGDNPDRMREVFETALSRADLVITSGGLGATQGDITKKAGAEAMHLPFVKREEESKRLKAYYEARGRTFIPALDRQSWFAEGAHILPNDVGSASGSAVVHDGHILVHLPGPPFEMKTMAQNHLLPWLISKVGSQGIIRSVILPVTGMTETEVEDRLMDMVKSQSNPTMAFLARPGYIAVRLTARGTTEEETEALLAPWADEIRRRIPVESYQLEGHVEEDLAEELLERKLTLGAAESCTGGLIGKLITDRPGSSVYFKGSAVTYWNEAKEHVLHVSGETLREFTAVSRETAEEMAEGARKLYNADIAISTTGYAGPGRGERGEPAGLVYIGIAGPRGTEVTRCQFMGDRDHVRMGAAEKACYLALTYIRKFNLRSE
jgi:nicotinamide-nucleotide amidase